MIWTEVPQPSVFGTCAVLALFFASLLAISSALWFGGRWLVRRFGQGSEEVAEHRDIGDVLGEVLDLVPASEQMLRRRLESIRERARYSAPEIRDNLWFNAARALEEFIPSPELEWEKAAVRVFTGKDSP